LISDENRLTIIVILLITDDTMRFSRIFQPGDSVPASGVYSVVHSSPHAPVQREMFFEGGRFPTCPNCPAGVAYRLESPCVATRMPIPMFAWVA